MRELRSSHCKQLFSRKACRRPLARGGQRHALGLQVGHQPIQRTPRFRQPLARARLRDLCGVPLRGGVLDVLFHLAELAARGFGLGVQSLHAVADFGQRRGLARGFSLEVEQALAL